VEEEEEAGGARCEAGGGRKSFEKLGGMKERGWKWWREEDVGRKVDLYEQAERGLKAKRRAGLWSHASVLS
jgi:hypothetical protein